MANSDYEEFIAALNGRRVQAGDDQRGDEGVG